MNEHTHKKAYYLRNFVFGVEDSLVSTVGFLSGVATAGVSSMNIIISGLVLIFVEAFSMAMGSLVSEHSVQEYLKQQEVGFKKSLFGSIIMFVSYFVSGFIPLLPYLFWKPEIALGLSILASLIMLFVLGAISAIKSGLPVMRHGFEILMIGGFVILVGVVVGQAAKGYVSG